jgi:hypothetical protein
MSFTSDCRPRTKIFLDKYPMVNLFLCLKHLMIYREPNCKNLSFMGKILLIGRSSLVGLSHLSLNIHLIALFCTGWTNLKLVFEILATVKKE